MSILRTAAKGRDCQVRSDYCNYNADTTVLAHLNGAGLAIKHHDLLGAWACSSCHDYIDNRSHTRDSNITRQFLHMLGIIRTVKILIDDGYIQIIKPVQPKLKKYLPRNYG